jgi:tetratricopeptide (TPR) repeat protein
MLVFLLGLAMHGLYLAQARRGPSFAVPIVDAATYHEQAVGFAEGGPLRAGAFWQPPAYPWALGWVYRAFGVGVWAPRALQALLGALSAVLVWWIGRQVFSPAVGLLAGVILTGYGPLLFFDAHLLPAGLAVFLVLSSLAAFVSAVRRGHWRWWLAFGALVGLSAITVANALVIAVGGIVWWGVVGWRRGPRWACPVLVGALVVGAAIPVAVVCLRNHAVSGDWVLISTNGPINFYLGNNPRADETVAIRPGQDWQQQLRAAYAHGAKTKAEETAYFRRLATEYLTEQPLAFLRHLVIKLGRFLNSRETPRNMDVYVHREFSRLLSLLVWRWGSFGFPFGVVCPLAGVGLLSLWRREANWSDRGSAGWLAFLGLLYALSVVAFFVTARYRLPVTPLFVLFAAAGLVWMLGLVRGGAWITRRRTDAVLTGACLIVGAGVTNWPIHAPTDAVNFRAELYTNVGRGLLEQGHFEQAEAAFDVALRDDAEFAPAYHQLGLLRAHQGRLVEAQALFKHSLQIREDQPEVQWMLGQALMFLGQPGPAREAIERSLALDAFSPEAHAVLGDLLMHEGEPALAVEKYRRALDLPPERPEILVSLAGALEDSGRYAEAIETYRQASMRMGPRPDLLRRAALLLATCPRKELRRCDLAVAFAEQLCAITEARDPVAFETLGVAYCECGQRQRGRKAFQTASELVALAGDEELAERIRSKTVIYFPP